MSQQLLIIVGIALLALGTYSIRFAGFHLGAKFSFYEKYQVLIVADFTEIIFIFYAPDIKAYFP